MKKILLASTALVGFAGVAAAEVSISGYAEMGIIGGSNTDAQFFNDVDVTFSMSGETDGGLSFGVSVDLDESAAIGSATVENEVAVFISGDFGRLTLGDTDGAMDWALQDQNIGHPGSINDEETSHAGWGGSYLDDYGFSDGQILRYQYSFGDFGFAVSLEQDLTGNGTTSNNDIGFAIGGNYSIAMAGGSIGIGVGYQEGVEGTGVGGTTPTAAGISLAYSSDMGLSAVIIYTDYEDVVRNGGQVESHIGLGVAYTTGALTVAANYGEYEGTVAANDSNGFAINASYELGGGASVRFGYYDEEQAGGVKEDRYSLGLALSF
jgi:outer membrane protein OmpU